MQQTKSVAPHPSPDTPLTLNRPAAAPTRTPAGQQQRRAQSTALVTWRHNAAALHAHPACATAVDHCFSSGRSAAPAPNQPCMVSIMSSCRLASAHAVFRSAGARDARAGPRACFRRSPPTAMPHPVLHRDRPLRAPCAQHRLHPPSAGNCSARRMYKHPPQTISDNMHLAPHNHRTRQSQGLRQARPLLQLQTGPHHQPPSCSGNARMLYRAPQLGRTSMHAGDPLPGRPARAHLPHTPQPLCAWSERRMHSTDARLRSAAEALGRELGRELLDQVAAVAPLARTQQGVSMIGLT